MNNNELILLIIVILIVLFVLLFITILIIDSRKQYKEDIDNRIERATGERIDRRARKHRKNEEIPANPAYFQENPAFISPSQSNINPTKSYRNSKSNKSSQNGQTPNNGPIETHYYWFTFV